MGTPVGREPAALDDIRAFYHLGEDLVVASLPPGTLRVVASRATGEVVEAQVGGHAHFGGLEAGTYCIEALGPGGKLLAEQLTTIGAHPGERPVHGFATSFLPESLPEVLSWLRALRCTVVQIYDWMERYSAPLGPLGGWRDPSGREVSFEALRSLAGGIRANGAVAHAYAPIYAVDLPFAAEHPELLLYRGDGAPERLFDNIVLANPSDRRWQRHFASTYGRAADSIGFNGFHIDSYGFPRAGLDREGEHIDAREAYESFLDYFRTQRPADQVSFNQVNGVPSPLRLPRGPGFRYCEVWPPNDRWRHLEGLLDRSAGEAGLRRRGNLAPSASAVRGTIACYPPVWAGAERGARESALRTVVLTEAIATCLGASALLYGDAVGVLSDPYYPGYERLSPGEAETALAWHRFALRYRDLFLEGEDTSWYEIGDENGAVSVHWDGPVRPEPVGGALFARVVRSDNYVVVGIVDLTGSADGSWSRRTSAGRCTSARARLLLAFPDDWKAAVATLGSARDRFVPVPITVVEHREGLAAEVDIPMAAGWSVLRLTKR
jgi:dextranase